MMNKIKATKSLSRGQSMAEFSLVLPILLVVLFGLLEVGRAVFMYAAVVNASREAVRYATAYGVDESDVLNYQNCAEIRNTAKRVGFLLSLEDNNITIEHDTGPGSSKSPYCAPGVNVDTSIEMNCGDRVVVTVTYDYHPIVSLVPMEDQTFNSSSARTYLGIVELSEDAPECK